MRVRFFKKVIVLLLLKYKGRNKFNSETLLYPIRMKGMKQFTKRWLLFLRYQLQNSNWDSSFDFYCFYNWKCTKERNRRIYKQWWLDYVFNLCRINCITNLRVFCICLVLKSNQLSFSELWMSVLKVSSTFLKKDFILPFLNEECYQWCII